MVSLAGHNSTEGPLSKLALDVVEYIAVLKSALNKAIESSDLIACSIDPVFVSNVASILLGYSQNTIKGIDCKTHALELEKKLKIARDHDKHFSVSRVKRFFKKQENAPDEVLDSCMIINFHLSSDNLESTLEWIRLVLGTNSEPVEPQFQLLSNLITRIHTALEDSVKSSRFTNQNISPAFVSSVIALLFQYQGFPNAHFQDALQDSLNEALIRDGFLQEEYESKRLKGKVTATVMSGAAGGTATATGLLAAVEGGYIAAAGGLLVGGAVLTGAVAAMTVVGTAAYMWDRTKGNREDSKMISEDGDLILDEEETLNMEGGATIIDGMRMVNQKVEQLQQEIADDEEMNQENDI